MPTNPTPTKAELLADAQTLERFIEVVDMGRRQAADHHEPWPELDGASVVAVLAKHEARRLRREAEELRDE